MRRLGELTDMGHTALVRYRELQEQPDLDESIRHFEHARDLCPVEHPRRATVLFNLATAKLIYCRVNDVSPNLDVPIDLYRAALRLRPHGHPDRPFTLLSLGIALQARFQRQRDAVDEAEAQNLLSQVMDVSPTDSHPYHAAVLALGSAAKPELIERTETSQTDENNVDDHRKVERLDTALQWMFYPDSSWHGLLDHLGVLFCIQLYDVPDLVDPEKAKSILEAVVRFTSDNHPDKAMLSNALGKVLLTHYERFGDLIALERSISMKEEAVRLTADGDPNKPTWLNSFGYSLSARYEHFGDIVDLEKSISVTEEALQFTPDGHPDKAAQLVSLGYSLSTRYKRFREVVDLEKSISIREETLQLTPDGHPDKASRLAALGYSLSMRYKRFGDIVDMEKSISMAEEALLLTPDNHADKASRLASLGHSLSTRYQRFGDDADLEKSISMREEALQLTPDGHPNRALRLTHLGTSLSTRYERFGDVVDLGKSISMLGEALQLALDNNADRAAGLANLGYALWIRYERFGNVVDLEKSISMTEEALQLTPDGHPDRALRLANLGISLSTRYQRFGDVVDLEKSISIKEEAMQLTRDDHPRKSLWLNNLACSFSARYERFRNVVDLEKSISLREEALQLTPDGHPYRALQLGNLGSLLSTRYERFGEVVDLEKSISMLEDALLLTPSGHPDKAFRLTDLGMSLLTRYQRFGNVVDLGKSISMLEEALLLTPENHPEKSLRLATLGDSLLARYERFGGAVDLEKSISMTEEAMEFTPDGHPLRSLHLHHLSSLLVKRFQRSGDPSNSDLPRAILHLSQAARSRTGPSSHRFQAARHWIWRIRLLQRHDSQSLLDAYTVAVDLLPQLAWIGLSLHDRSHQLLQAVDTVCDAAAAALEAHLPERAVEWLEQGRSIVWSQLSQLRTPVDDLRTAHPGLAAQFERVSHELDRASAQDRAAVGESTDHSNVTDGLLENQARQRHALALSREGLLAEIRALPGFERFLLPKTIDQLASLTHLGPVVFLNASKHRCDALVVVAGSKRVVHVPLSNTNYDEVALMQLRLNQLLRLNPHVILHDDSNRGTRLSGMNPDEMFGHILPSLWDKVVSPILDALAFSVCELQVGDAVRLFMDKYRHLVVNCLGSSGVPLGHLRSFPSMQQVIMKTPQVANFQTLLFLRISLRCLRFNCHSRKTWGRLQVHAIFASSLFLSRARTGRLTSLACQRR